MSQPYLSLEAELHDAFWDAEDDGSECHRMAEFLRQHPGPALEVGCGSGRLMFPLLKTGFEIEGLELSPAMIEHGLTRADHLEVRPVVHLADMCDWHPVRRFAAVLAPAFTLQLAADPEATLRHWHGWLENHGGLYLTVFMPYAELLGDLPENTWYDDHRATLHDGRQALLQTRHQLDHQLRTVHRDHRYSLTAGAGKPALSHQSRQSIRWIEHREMLTLLDSAGFAVQRFFLDFDPAWTVADPDDIDFDGIITYHATRIDPIS
jgi:SAM-dependent methyltransferase